MTAQPLTASDPAPIGATQRNDVETARRLIAAGADVNLPDNQGITPLGHARRRGQREIASILEAAGAR